MSERVLKVYDDAAVMAKEVAHRTLRAVIDAEHSTDGRYDIGLTGGSDSIQALKDMASDSLVRVIDWSRVHFWWGDERFVSAVDPDRNALQARRAFLGGLVEQGLLPESNIHEMAADRRSVEQASRAEDEENDQLVSQAAVQYARELIHQLGPAGATPSQAEAVTCIKPLDLLVLGMGPDGHFGSLFPAPAHHEIEVTDRLVVGVAHSPKMPPLRVSLSAPFMARSTRTWMMTKGAGKAHATAGVFSRRDNPEFPSSFADGAEEFIWFTTPDTLAETSVDNRR